MNCNNGEINNTKFIACGSEKISDSDMEELKKYEQFRRDRHNKLSLKEKRIKAKSIDLTNNHTIEDLGNGYSQIVPIDENKRWGS